MLNEIEREFVESPRWFPRDKKKEEANENKKKEYKEQIKQQQDTIIDEINELIKTESDKLAAKEAVEEAQANITKYKNLIKKIKLNTLMSKEDYEVFSETIMVNPLLDDVEYYRLIKKTIDGAFELCIREEFTLRSLQANEKKLNPNKIWFLDTEKAIYNQFEQKAKIKRGKNKKNANSDSDDE
jgi:hypothetical protein